MTGSQFHDGRTAPNVSTLLSCFLSIILVRFFSFLSFYEMAMTPSEDQVLLHVGIDMHVQSSLLFPTHFRAAVDDFAAARALARSRCSSVNPFFLVFLVGEDSDWSGSSSSTGRLLADAAVDRVVDRVFLVGRDSGWSSSSSSTGRLLADAAVDRVVDRVDRPPQGRPGAC